MSAAAETVPPDGVAEAIGPVLAIDHVGVAVPDLDVAVAFYRRTFGLREVAREANTEQRVVEAMLAAVGPDGSGAPNGPDVPGGPVGSARTAPARLQLLAPLDDQSPIARFLHRSGPGLQQLAFRVADVAAATERLHRAGLRVLYPAPRPGSLNSMINFVHPKDAGGVLIELVQPGED